MPTLQPSRGIALCLVTVSFLSSMPNGFAVEVDESKLPRPAAVTIDFSRDIKPIFANHCLKCHSDEKPKSSFRLTTREAALKGGEHGVDIIPGQSGKSPLIIYVARLDEEMAMPPEGRGTPLTPEQVALLRAWIDQGMVWEPSFNEPETQLTVAPTVGWTTVSGDEKKFRELYWQREQWNGGVEDFDLVERPTSDSKITASGHFLLDDYKLKLSAEKDNLGFVHFGWARFRKYYDDTGGYYPSFNPSSFDLHRDLHVDDGRASVDLGLTLPRWPRIVFGYEYQYRQGTESTLQWGPVSNRTETRNIYPAFKDLSEKVHILKFDVDYDLGGLQLNDSFRGEWYRLATAQFNDTAYTLGSPNMALTTAQENQSYFQGANTFHLEKQFTDWILGSGGYLYSKLDADGTRDVALSGFAPYDANLPSALGWNANDIQLERESHVFSLSGLLGPWEGLTLSLGIQNEWTRQVGFGQAEVNVFDPTTINSGFPLPPESISSSLDQRMFSQNVELRFTKLPFSTLFAGVRFEQDSYGLYEDERDFEGDLKGGATPFVRQTDATRHLGDFRAGFNTSPWRRISLSGYYRRYENNTDYDNLLKEIPSYNNEGYPAFMQSRELLSNEAQMKLALQMTTWLKTSISYQFLDNDYHTATAPVTTNITTNTRENISPGGELLAGTYNAHIASANATLTPWRRLFLSTTFSYQNARTITFANGSTSVQPYAGNIYSVILSGNYALNPKTDLMATYAFSTADFAQDNFTTGLPLGINYHQHTLQAGIKRHISKQASIGFQYRFYLYDEPSGGGANNFEAHGIFTTLVCRLP